MIIFDSGVGGFSIVRALPPGLAYTYLADQAYFPYGSKSMRVLTSRLRAVADWLSTLAPDIVVVACNSASVTSLAYFRQKLSCPVVGVEPVIKPASQFGRALVLGTRRTLQSANIKALKARYRGDVYLYTPRSLAKAIEDQDAAQISSNLSTVARLAKRLRVEAIGLSCTHYPLVQGELSAKVGGLSLLDPSSAVAKVILRAHPSPRCAPAKFLTTGNVLRFKQQISAYLGVVSEPTQIKI